MDVPHRDTSSCAASSGSSPATPETSGRMPTAQHTCTSTEQRQSTRHARRQRHTSSWPTVAWLTLLTAALLLPPCCARPPQRGLTGRGGGPQSVAAVLQKNNLGRFSDLLQKAGVLDTVSDPNWSGTLFAPVDRAFNNMVSQQQVNTNQLSAELLKLIMNYHILSTPLNVNDMKHGAELATAAGQSLFVDRRSTPQVLTIRGFSSTANVIKSFKIKDNAVVHIISSMLYPNTGAVVGCSSTMDLIAKLGRRDFYNLVVFAGMTDQLNGQGTVLVPSNAALTLSKSLKVAQAQAMVSAYILSGGIWTQSLMYQGMTLTSRSGTSYAVQQPGSGQRRFGLKRGGKVVALGNAYLACQAVVFRIEATLS